MKPDDLTCGHPAATPRRFRAALAALIAAAGLLAACSAPAPARYYTLLPAPSGAGTAEALASTSGTPGFALQVLPVRVPPASDLPQLLVRSSDGQVVPQENDRWLGPLADEIRSAVVAQLTRELGVPEVSSVAIPPGLPVYRLQIDVTRFGSARGQYALQETNWSLRDLSTPPSAAGAAPQAVLLCRGRQVVPAAGTGTAALVDGHQQALRQLVRQIETTLKQPPAQWRCA
ncbi:MAG: hypothetical protein GAK30_03123 [Paracidovorax wautersii]|uniref:ABC-type transport auxiliary lipoprotein component domain-containing protein n=1 Tax=Paracidovorax wautersii TaxID=1177982 RepID=A0A7V8JP62_9BURK|nr:MAG: hypothetical protein GAK30_03123 [Paracidovorax wautersii]